MLRSPELDGPRPLVTICIIAYRRPTTLIQALLSCVSQDYRPLEIDIGDDSPNECSEDAMRCVPLPPGVSLRYHRNAPALGEPGNVNHLFKHARGSLLLLLHDDDTLLPGAVSALAEALVTNPQAVAAFGLQGVIRSSGEIDFEKAAELNSRYHRSPVDCGLIEDPLLSGLRRQFPNNAYLVKAFAARQVGYRTVEEIGRAGDADFGIRLGKAFADAAYVLVPNVVSQYRFAARNTRSNVGISWKLYDALESMSGLTAEQAEARNGFLSSSSCAALVDNALHGKRLRSLHIFRTSGYQATASFRQKIYHLLLILMPSLYKFRKYIRVL